jgi:hypothetical protein
MGTVALGHLPISVQKHVNAKLGIVYLSSQSLSHIREKHKVELMDMLCLPDMISSGLWIGEAHGRACVVYSDPNTQRRYISAIKVANQGYEVFLTTFHLCRQRQTASLLKRGAILQKHK